MTMQTPIEPASPWTAPPSDEAAGQGAAPPPAAKRGWPVWAWLLLGLAVLLAAGAVVAAVVVAGGGEDTAVVNTHTVEAGEPALISVPGYAYEDLTGDDLAFFDEQLVYTYTSANEPLQVYFPDHGDFYSGWSGHSVVAADGEVAALFLVSVNQDYLDAGVMIEEALVEGMSGPVAGERATVTTETIAGEEVMVAEGGDDWLGTEGMYNWFGGDHSFAWFHDNVVTGVTGPDEGDARAFVEAYLEAAQE